MKKEVSVEHPLVQKKIEKSLKSSVVEGSFAASSIGFGNSYLSPFALALNATSSQIGVLNGVISLVPAFVQLKASRFMERFSRKKIVVLFVILQALVFIPIVGVSYLFFLGYEVVWLLIVLVGLLFGLGAASGPAWFSWMGSLVPEGERGKYFSRRNRVTGFFGLIAMVIGALVLDKSEVLGMVLVGFGILFSLAMVGKFISGLMFIGHYEPRLKIRKRDYFSFWDFLKKGRDTPFGRFTIYTTFMRIATNIAGPFFAVYMLRDLGFSYTWFMAITISGSVFQLLFYPLMGKISDRYGNIRLLRISTGLFILTPLLWILSKNPFYLISVPQLIGGFAWSGFFLATNNYIYDSIREEKRGLGLAYYNLLTGMGLFVGAGIGAGIALLNITFMNKLLFIFLISGIARALVFIFTEKSLREVRHVKEFSSSFLIKQFTPHGLVREVHRLEKFGKRVGHYI